MSILLGIAVLFFGLTIGLIPLFIIVPIYIIICYPGQFLFSYGDDNDKAFLQFLGAALVYPFAAYYSCIYTVSMVILARALADNTQIPAWALFTLALVHSDAPSFYTAKYTTSDSVFRYVACLIFPITIPVYFLSVFWPAPIQWAFAWMPYISSLG